MREWRTLAWTIIVLQRAVRDQQDKQRSQPSHSFHHRCSRLLPNCLILPTVCSVIHTLESDLLLHAPAHSFLCNVEKIIAVLRDGRKLIGVLRSWDQFGMMLPFVLTLSRYHDLSSSLRQSRSSGHHGAVYRTKKQDLRRHKTRHLPCSRRKSLNSWRNRGCTIQTLLV